MLNTSARLESVNKHLGTRICVSGATSADFPGFRGRPVGTLVLKGKSIGIDTYESLEETELESPRIKAYREAFRLLDEEQPAASKARSRCSKRAKLCAVLPSQSLADTGACSGYLSMTAHNE